MSDRVTISKHGYQPIEELTGPPPPKPIPMQGQPEILIRSPGGTTGNPEEDRITNIILVVGFLAIVVLFVTLGLAMIL